MKFNNYFKLIIALVVPALAATIGSTFTEPAIRSGWYDGLVKPALNPPAWVFGPVWTVLYVLIGISLYLVWKNNWHTLHHVFERDRRAWNPLSERMWRGDLQKFNVIAVFGMQYILNIAWSYIFFSLQFSALAFFEILALWLAIVWTIINFYRISKPAAYLLVPYLLWVSFAVYLNYAIWTLN